MLFIIILFSQKIINTNLLIILICTYLFIVATHIALHLASINSKNKFLFTNEILNGGNVLTITTNKNLLRTNKKKKAL